MLTGMNLPLSIPSLFEDPSDIRKKLGRKAKDLRLFKGYKRSTIAEMSGVSLKTIQNFEGTGKITLDNFIKIAYALDESRKLDILFSLPEIKSLSDIRKVEKPQPKRGKK